MEYFLHGCQNLESVDVSNFDTSSVTNMRYMFSSLYSLKSLKLSNNFNTANVIDMSGMFYDIQALTSMNLSMFYTSEVNNFSYMFSGARKLKYLNISNFKIRNYFYFSYYNIFADCDELQYLEINQIKLDNPEKIYEIFPINNENFKICIKDGKDGKKNDYSLYNSFQSIFGNIICSDTCINENNIYIDKVQNKCVQSCDKELYIYGLN